MARSRMEDNAFSLQVLCSLPGPMRHSQLKCRNEEKLDPFSREKQQHKEFPMLPNRKLPMALEAVAQGASHACADEMSTNNLASREWLGQGMYMCTCRYVYVYM